MTDKNEMEVNISQPSDHIKKLEAELADLKQLNEKYKDLILRICLEHNFHDALINEKIVTEAKDIINE